MSAVGTVTLSETTYSGIRRVKFAWTSDASGNVSGTPTVGVYDGILVACATTPGAGGTQPTSYGITISDADGNDILCGSGSARSTTATEYIKSPQGAVAASVLSIGISAAGASKTGTAYLWIR